MNKQVIGIVTIDYDKEGKVEKAQFEPKMRLWNTDKVKEQLKSISCPSKVETLKHNAETVFSSWFNQNTQMELADREEGYIDSEILSCQRYSNDSISKCVIEYSFKTITCSVSTNEEIGCG